MHALLDMHDGNVRRARAALEVAIADEAAELAASGLLPGDLVAPPRPTRPSAPNRHARPGATPMQGGRGAGRCRGGRVIPAGLGDPRMGADTVAPGRAAALVDARLPVFQAGMGGIAGPCLVAAVAEAGGAGIIGLYKHNPDEIAALIAEAADLTDRPFGINLVPEVVSEPTLLDQVRG
ncbi:nitronate monooxygenase [Tistrella bauzanensis]